LPPRSITSHPLGPFLLHEQYWSHLFASRRLRLRIPWLEEHGPDVPARAPSPYQSNWAQETFIKSDEAEAALCVDRSVFVLRHAIVEDHPRLYPSTWIRIDWAAKGYQKRWRITSRYPADDTVCGVFTAHSYDSWTSGTLGSGVNRAK
jgi:hypothetical protein